ncbi:glutathione-disulfide reductase [Devosia sp. Leaf64]|uniref:glutathione-disulfide reductase n=1 Tax=Devosia sp. Leaf64 TaxID=1736229 RepID=UPI0007146B75|nr:glutathione-disulfide reductase [Devosia sp. Leaf64]KQN72908.1 glutathione reductase [Devosia sp. Leaf64]
MAYDYDLLVIGAGSGGVRAARMAATYGAKVAIIEEFRVGGTCVIRGCVPKKLYVYASRFSDQFDLAPSFGWQVEASFDWPTLVAAKEKEISRLESAYTANLEKPGVEIIRDRAVVTGPNSLRLTGSGRELTAERLLIATGSHPFIPEVPGAEFGITSNEAFDLPTLPKTILIEGGGYIAVEFATIFAGLGVDTTLIYRGDCILRGFDEDMRRGLEAALTTRGVRTIYQTTIASLANAGDKVQATLSDGITAPFDAVMFATGRRANTTGLGLETAGVKLNDNGSIAVDAYSQSSTPSIYAVGDVTGRAQLTPVAIREGWYFAETVYNNNPQKVDYSLIPTAVFSEPEIGVVGLTEEEAATHGDVDVYLARFRPMQNTLSTRTERMVMKLITEKDEGKVLGVHIFGPGAGEMIQLVGVAMSMGATKKDLDRTIALHPTAAEELVTFKSPSYTYRDCKKVG